MLSVKLFVLASWCCRFVQGRELFKRNNLMPLRSSQPTGVCWVHTLGDHSFQLLKLTEIVFIFCVDGSKQQDIYTIESWLKLSGWRNSSSTFRRRFYSESKDSKSWHSSLSSSPLWAPLFPAALAVFLSLSLTTLLLLFWQTFSLAQSFCYFRLNFPFCNFRTSLVRFRNSKELPRKPVFQVSCNKKIKRSSSGKASGCEWTHFSFNESQTFLLTIWVGEMNSCLTTKTVSYFC